MPTEDGWEPSPRIDPSDPLLVWRTVPGSNVTLQVRNDDAGTAMLAYAADYHAYVEPLVDRMTACYTPTNSVSTSNHLNATAMDFNWEYYPWKQRGNLNGDKLARLRDLLAYWRGIMFWAGDWSDAYVDEMHHQMDYGSYDLERNGQLGQWIKDHIRADGFSTYRRGNAPPPPAGLTAQNLHDAMGGSLSVDRYAQLLPAYRNACIQAGLAGNLNRLAMFAAQLGEESGGLQWMEEIASGSEYEGRSDLGNTQPGDGVRFKGRGPIQITGRNNYSQLSQWAFGKGYVPSPTFFVDNPTQLSTDQYGFLGPVWYWTVARPQINSLCDAGDIVGVTKAINGGTNGLQDRTNRWNHCLAMGLAALDVQGTTVPATPGDDMAAVPQDQWDRVYRELTQRLPSRSPLRHLDQTQYYPDGLVDTMAGMVLNTDGSEHVQYVSLLAGYGHPPTLALLREVASAAGDSRYPDRQDDAKLAQAILAQATQAPATFAPVDTTPIAAPQPQVVYLPAAPTPATPAPPAADPTEGDLIGNLFENLKALRLADALPIEGRAPLAALISVLQTKNGSQL